MDILFNRFFVSLHAGVKLIYMITLSKMVMRTRVAYKIASKVAQTLALSFCQQLVGLQIFYLSASASRYTF